MYKGCEPIARVNVFAMGFKGPLYNNDEALFLRERNIFSGVIILRGGKIVFKKGKVKVLKELLAEAKRNHAH